MNSEDFVAILFKKVEQAEKEYEELLHEKRRLEMLGARALEYLGGLNAFLVKEGHEPVALECMGNEKEIEMSDYIKRSK